MHYTPGLKKLINTNLKYATKLYGVKVRIYAPLEDFNSSLQYWGDVKYSESPVYEDKLLIPEYLYRTSNNPYTASDFLEEPLTCYTKELLPKLGKVIITELKDYNSFIITQSQDFRDSSADVLYYQYTLLSSSELLNRTESTFDELIHNEMEDEIELNGELGEAVEGTNESIDTPLDPEFKYRRV